jgi:hypothetical protein
VSPKHAIPLGTSACAAASTKHWSENHRGGTAFRPSRYAGVGRSVPSATRTLNLDGESMASSSLKPMTR